MDDSHFSLALSENRALKDEVTRLRQENDDLRTAAGWWIFLYESALVRANFYEAQLSSLEARARRPPGEQPYRPGVRDIPQC
jgi:hypothetical protein